MSVITSASWCAYAWSAGEVQHNCASLGILSSRQGWKPAACKFNSVAEDAVDMLDVCAETYLNLLHA